MMPTPNISDLEYLLYGGGSDAKYAALQQFADDGVTLVDLLGGSGGSTDLNRIVLGPNDFINTVGSPVRGPSATGSLLRWQHPTGATTAVSGTFFVPEDWTTFSATYLMMGATATTGNVVLQPIIRKGPAVIGGVAGTTDTASIPAMGTSFTVTITTQWEIIGHVDTRGPFNAVAGAPYTYAFARLGGAVQDDYAGALDFLGIVLEKVT